MKEAMIAISNKLDIINIFHRLYEEQKIRGILLHKCQEYYNNLWDIKGKE